MSLRREIHSAFDGIAPPLRGIPERVVQTVLADKRRRRKEGMVLRLRAPLSLVAALTAIALVGAALVGGRIVQDWNLFHNVSPAGHAQLPQLEARPLAISYPKSYLDCLSGPFNAAGLFGSGPVYGAPGATISSSWGVYYHNTAYADSDINGLILIRAVDLFTKQPVVFIGQYAAGPVVGSDTLLGKTYQQHSELLLNSSNASKTATHLFVWQFMAGVPKSWSGSSGWQIDGIGFSEVFYAC